MSSDREEYQAEAIDSCETMILASRDDLPKEPPPSYETLYPVSNHSTVHDFETLGQHSIMPLGVCSVQPRAPIMPGACIPLASISGSQSAPGAPDAPRPGASYIQPHQPRVPYMAQEMQSQAAIFRRPQVNQWTYDICDCFDDPLICWMSFWCSCVVFGENAAAVGKDSCVWGTAYLFASLFLIPWVPGTMLREDIRRKQGIEGDCCNDCMTWWMLGPCALCQEAQELQVNHLFKQNRKTL